MNNSGLLSRRRCLWCSDLNERATNKKRYSVTTSAGIKIQPYFDVPPPGDPNLTYFRVQSEPLDGDTIVLWVAAATATQLQKRLGSIDKDVVSSAVFKAAQKERNDDAVAIDDLHPAVPIMVSKEAFDLLIHRWKAVNDDHRVQLLIQSF